MTRSTLKGIFVTTSFFDEKTITTAYDTQHSIILIAGNKLVDLIYQYGVGMQIRNIYEIKEIDENFFENN